MIKSDKCKNCALCKKRLAKLFSAETQPKDIMVDIITNVCSAEKCEVLKSASNIEDMYFLIDDISEYCGVKNDILMQYMITDKPSLVRGLYKSYGPRSRAVLLGDEGWIYNLTYLARKYLLESLYETQTYHLYLAICQQGHSKEPISSDTCVNVHELVCSENLPYLCNSAHKLVEVLFPDNIKIFSKSDIFPKITVRYAEIQKHILDDYTGFVDKVKQKVNLNDLSFRNDLCDIYMDCCWNLHYGDLFDTFVNKGNSVRVVWLPEGETFDDYMIHIIDGKEVLIKKSEII